MSIDYLSGSLPDSWSKSELGQVAETQLGKMLNSSKQTGLAVKPYLRNVNLQWGRIDLSDVKEMDIFDDELEQFMLKKGDVLICEGGETGRTAVWNLDIHMGFQNAIHRVRPSNNLLSEFVCYQFEWLVKNGYLNENFTGVTIKHFSQQKLRKVIIAIPPLNEQEKIIEILEEQLSRITAVHATVRVVREKANQFRRSLLYAAFSGALTGHDTATGVLPTGWDEKQLGEVADVGWGDLQVTKSSYVPEGNLAYSATGPDGFLDYFDFDRDGIVLSAIGAGCGRTWFAKGKWSAIKNTMTITEKSNEVGIRFLFQQLSDPEAWPKRGSGQPFISQKDARELAVRIPPVAEQEKIVDVLEEQFSRLNASLALVDNIEMRAKALRRSLLNSAFTGDLTKEWREGAHV
jgi:type I restriction enzyme S subunit